MSWIQFKERATYMYSSQGTTQIMEKAAAMSSNDKTVAVPDQPYERFGLDHTRDAQAYQASSPSNPSNHQYRESNRHLRALESPVERVRFIIPFSKD
jgi:hypothetical protein